MLGGVWGGVPIFPREQLLAMISPSGQFTLLKGDKSGGFPRGGGRFRTRGSPWLWALGVPQNFMVGFWEGFWLSRFFFFFAVMGALLIAGYAFFNFIGAMAPNQPLAMNLFFAGVQFLMFFWGYFIPGSGVPREWSWAPSVSFARYLFGLLALNGFAPGGDDGGVGGPYWVSFWGFRGISKGKVFFFFVLSVGGFPVFAWLAMKYVSFARG
eukprot:FR739324.1.p1 GENE.FR739324.1~~FR739324.1.p1  ORF type:complete len:211 (-),score=62.43 FR739324.1:145-777(-)